MRLFEIRKDKWYFYLFFKDFFIITGKKKKKKKKLKIELIIEFTVMENYHHHLFYRHVEILAYTTNRFSGRG